MKKYEKIFFMVILVAVFLAGCGGWQKSSLNTSEKGLVVHQNANYSLLMPSPGPIELARAQKIAADAKLTEILTTKVQSGASAEVGQIIGVIINDDPSETAFVPHPNLQQRVEVLPNSAVFISVDNIPAEMTVYKRNGQCRSFHITPKTKTYNGVLCKFGLRIKNL